MAGEPLAPRIFFSYAGEDAYWIDLFRPHFSGVVGPVRILDYRADAVPYGPLGQALGDQIEGSIAIVAFVSDDYRKKEWTVAEWEKGLAEAERRRLIFVPILLDADAKVWWQTLRRKEQLTALSRDHQYADFIDAGGGPALPGPNQPQVIQKIVRLALAVRKDLEEPPAPTPTPGSQELREVVVLGHPKAGLPQELQDQAKELVSSLGGGVVVWKDGWQRKEASRKEIKVGTDPVFVQPVPDAEAVDYAQDPNKTNSLLTELGRSTPRVTIWLPSPYYRDAEFEETKARKLEEGGKDPDKFPALRTDTPGDLAKWLRTEIDVPAADDTMILQIEGYGSEEGSKPENALAAKQIVDGLKDEMWKIVSRVVHRPRPASPAWQFWDTEFGRQLTILPGSRAIVAVHDLDIPPSPDLKTIRKKVELKFDRLQKDVDAEQKQRNKDHKPPLKLFWTALLVNHTKALPFSNYPDDGRYKDWRLLGFSDKERTQGSVPVPDRASLAVFRTNLLAWTASA